MGLYQPMCCVEKPRFNKTVRIIAGKAELNIITCSVLFRYSRTGPNHWTKYLVVPGRPDSFRAQMWRPSGELYPSIFPSDNLSLAAHFRGHPNLLIISSTTTTETTTKAAMSFKTFWPVLMLLRFLYAALHSWLTSFRNRQSL